MKIQIRRASPEIEFPRYGTPDAACFDFGSNENVTILPQQIKLIHTGLYLQAPKGYFLAVFPRSSTAKKLGLMFPHSVGIIDPDYSGPDDEILIQLYNFTDHPVDIMKNDHIAQGIFLPVQQVEWEEVTELRPATRGGFGSTGK